MQAIYGFAQNKMLKYCDFQCSELYSIFYSIPIIKSNTSLYIFLARICKYHLGLFYLGKMTEIDQSCYFNPSVISIIFQKICCSFRHNVIFSGLYIHIYICIKQ